MSRRQSDPKPYVPNEYSDHEDWQDVKGKKKSSRNGNHPNREPKSSIYQSDDRKRDTELVKQLSLADKPSSETCSQISVLIQANNHVQKLAEITGFLTRTFGSDIDEFFQRNEPAIETATKLRELEIAFQQLRDSKSEETEILRRRVNELETEQQTCKTDREAIKAERLQMESENATAEEERQTRFDTMQTNLKHELKEKLVKMKKKLTLEHEAEVAQLKKELQTQEDEVKRLQEESAQQKETAQKRAEKDEETSQGLRDSLKVLKSELKEIKSDVVVEEKSFEY
jgi:chromosome segregation ATPase